MKKTLKNRLASRERIIILSVLFAISLVLAVTSDSDKLMKGDLVEVVQKDNFYSSCKKTFLASAEVGGASVAWIMLEGCEWAEGAVATDTFYLRDVRKVAK